MPSMPTSVFGSQKHPAYPAAPNQGRDRPPHDRRATNYMFALAKDVSCHLVEGTVLSPTPLS
jgi:hypothetical protein